MPEMPKLLDQWLQDHEELVGWLLLLYQLLFAAIALLIIGSLVWRVVA